MGWSADTTAADDITRAPSTARRPPRPATRPRIGQTSATVAGVVDARGVATDYRFEFGETTLLGTQTAPGRRRQRRRRRRLGHAGRAAAGYDVPLSRRGGSRHAQPSRRDPELHHGGRRRRRPTPTPSATPTPTPTPPPFVPTTLQDRSLSASRKGSVKVKLKFGSTAAAGNARLSVLLGKHGSPSAARGPAAGERDEDAAAQLHRPPEDQARNVAQGHARAAPAGRQEGQEDRHAGA